MSYRRLRIPGATYFFTLVLQDRNASLLTDHIDTLRSAMVAVKRRYPVRVDGMVVLPEHLHMVWTLPCGDSDYSTRISMLKSLFSKSLPLPRDRTSSQQKREDKGIWQRRFWEHWIRDELDFHRHIDYVHINPVKHGLVARANQWPYSSIHQYIREGSLPPNWAADMPLMEHD
ncbi:REP-associated tyrosine transposase [Ferrimonas balearica]|uniref:REP-associated tyrosine transposase n=1 Tax=Ferrimonas balearica TaxID=44012 RepID=UPI001C9390C4|nr:transposase [Ferrimonas balearica]MBY6225125.1 transposase [Ferrimonas balearica]